MTIRRMLKMSDNNTIQLSVRIDKSTDERISKVMKETGMNKSQVVKMLLNPQTDNIQIKDGTKIAERLFDIELLLRNTEDEDIRLKVSEACKQLINELYNVFTKGDDESGNN